MRKPIAVILSTLLISVGVTLTLAGFFLPGRLDTALYFDTAIYGMGFIFVLLLLASAVFPWFAVTGYRKVLAILLPLEALGMLCLFVFIGMMRIMLDDAAVHVLLATLPRLYGVGLVAAGVTTYYLSREAYRPFAFEFFKQLPHAYYRYRT